MSWFPEWTSILVAAIVIGLVQGVLRLRHVRRNFDDRRFARFFGWPIEHSPRPNRIYWLEGVTQSEVENALYGYTDRRWGWLCRPGMRRALVVANPLSWILTVYGATDLPLSLGLDDTSVSWWSFTPIPLWLAARRSVRLISDAPAELLDERLVALRDRTYVSSYRVLSLWLGLAAALIFVLNDFISDLSADTIDTQLQLLTAAAYASIWAVPALPSVLLAWTLRNERPISNDSLAIDSI